MTSASVVNDTIFKAFVNLFEKCDTEKANFVRKSELVKIISSSVGNQNPNIEDLIISIIGRHDNNQYMTKNEFINKIKKYMNSNQECVENCKEPVTIDYYYDSPLNCSISSNSSNNELKRLESICDDLTVQLQNAEEQNTKLRNENYLISSSYEKLSTREKELQQLFEELQNDLAKKDNRCSILQRRLADGEKAVEKEREKCRELQDTLKRKSDDLAAVLTKLRTVQKENDARKREIVELERKLESKEDEYIACSKKLADLERSFESEMIDCLEKIDSLEQRNHSVEIEMLQGLARIQELESLYKDLEMKYRILEDSAVLNTGDQICDSTLSEIESNQEPTEILGEEDKLLAADSGCYDSLLSLRDEMEAEGECFDNFASFEERVDESELEMLYKINDQQKTIDTLTELIEKERQNNKMSVEAFERLKKDLSDCQETIDVLKREKQKVEEQWRADKSRLEEITSRTKTELKKPDNLQLQRLTVAKRDPSIRYNIEKQQMTIRKLVEKISVKSIPSTAVVSQESMTVAKFVDLDSKLSLEDSGTKERVENSMELVETEVSVCSKKAEIADLASTSKALVVMSSSNELRDADLSTNFTRKKQKNNENKTTHRLGSYSDCLLHPVLLCGCAAVTVAWLLYWALRESAISCSSSPPSPHRHHHDQTGGLVDQLICPYVNFKWNEPPPF